MTLFTKEDLLVGNRKQDDECRYTDCLIGNNSMWGPCDHDTCLDPDGHGEYESTNVRYSNDMNNLYDRIIAIKRPKP